MISNATRKLLSDAAKRNKFGGKIFDAKVYTDNDLNLMAEKYSSGEYLRSIFTEKIHATLSSWKNEIGHKIEITCRHKLYYYIDLHCNKVSSCPGCSKCRTADCYTESGKLKTKYCEVCTTNKVWAVGLRPERGAAISASKKKWYQTEEGQNFAKQLGKANSKKLKEFYQTPEGKANIEKSRIFNKKLMNDRILAGTFTPNSNNRNTHWDSSYNGKKYRSSWEALYHAVHPDDIYEQLRIVYTIANVQKIYILDFINHTSKVVTEVKPKKLCNGVIFNSKMAAIHAWCNCNNYSFQLVDLDFLKNLNINKDVLAGFDINTQRKILKIYE